jgi:hypothetical protein
MIRLLLRGLCQSCQPGPRAAPKRGRGHPRLVPTRPVRTTSRPPLVAFFPHRPPLAAFPIDDRSPQAAQVQDHEPPLPGPRCLGLPGGLLRPRHLQAPNQPARVSAAARLGRALAGNGQGQQSGGSEASAWLGLSGVWCPWGVGAVLAVGLVEDPGCWATSVSPASTDVRPHGSGAMDDSCVARTCRVA